MPNRLMTENAGLEIAKAIQAQRLASDSNYKNALERELANEFIAGRNGKVFATKIYKFASNPTSTGEYMLDSVGLTCEPSTDSSVGQDDFANASQIFQWQHCNYIRDADTTGRPIAIEGRPNFKTSGSVDVGIVAPTFWWNVVDHGSYDIFYMSDSPQVMLGLVPWIDAVTADGTILPFYVESSYPWITASDGLMRSQPGSYPAYNLSHDKIHTEGQKKGTGYWGGGILRVTFARLFLAIKYKTKNSQNIFAGCTSYSSQDKCALGETNVKRVLLTADNAKHFYVGGCVSVGVADGTNTDRGLNKMNSLANRVRIKSIETTTVSGTAYTALNLDTDTAFNTTTDTYVSTMPCFTGETDLVIGHYDGSFMSNTDGKHTFRIQGCEYSWGQYMIPSDIIYNNIDANYGEYYIAPKGVARASSIAGYTKIADDILVDNLYIGDGYYDTKTGAYIPIAAGSANTNGVGDSHWKDKSAGLRECRFFGPLWGGGNAGLSFVALGSDLGVTGWDYGAAD